MRFSSRSPEETAEAGRGLALAVDPEAGLFVSLAGPLGAGKTVWVKGAATGLGIDPDEVASPTFVIANRHEGARPLVHADLYRIESEGELLAAGFLDWLEPGVLVLVEWGDRFPDALPQDRLDLRIERRSEAERRFEAVARGPVARAALERFRSGFDERDERDREDEWR
jgi:tRNA threonylcarbamoyladenosine biosynthesis protein TsaE